MKGESIICFAKDWSEDPTSNNHVMVELARHNRVLWLNSIATRAPKLGSGRDLKKIFTKIAGFLRGPRRVRENLWVYTPLVLPLPHSRMAVWINRRILQLTLRLVRRELRMKEFQLWTFLPTAGDYVGKRGESLVVYYCVDEWSGFNYVNGDRVARAEEALCRRADIVFATAQSLVDKRRAWNRETHLARHGVDRALFAGALEPATPIPSDIASLPRPIIGFYGTLQDWVDLDLIAYLANRHPDWSIVLIGKPMADLSRLAEFPNIHVLGRRPHDQLPGYCKTFSVGIIPYVVNDRIRHVNPIKLREYLSAGLPVVSVAIPEVELLSQHCAVTNDYQQFTSAIELALRDDKPELRRRRSEAMASETWEQRVRELGAHVMRVKDQRCQQQRNSAPALSARAISATTT
jgi:glycosyltransferase involved in cell wall biosynthesis